MLKNKEYISRRYKAKSLSPTFKALPIPICLYRISKYVEESIVDGVVGISISTRPDCINDEYLEYLEYIGSKFNLEITIELGLQTVNYHTLKKSTEVIPWLSS